MIAWLALAGVPLLCAVVYAVKPTIRNARLSIIAMAVAVVGIAVDGVLSVQGGGMVPRGDRAAIVAASIAEALNCIFFGLLWVPVWSIPMVIGRRRRLRR